MFVLLICIISDTVSINNVQEKYYIGESFLNVTHSFLAACRKVILSGSAVCKIPLLF